MPSSIQLKKPIAKLVIKDLISGDGAKEELLLNIDKVKLLEDKIILKDSVIFNLKDQISNFKHKIRSTYPLKKIIRKIRIRFKKTTIKN